MTSANSIDFDPLGQLPGRPDHFVPPNPGGAAPAAARPMARQPDHGADHGALQRILSGSNALVALANPLLNLLPQIRTTVHHPDPAALREQLLGELRQFELRARQAGVTNETIVGARYCLCTALDEAATLTPWGG